MNNFKRDFLSTSYFVDKQGKLKFITFCHNMLNMNPEVILLGHPKRIEAKKGLIEALEYFKRQ